MFFFLSLSLISKQICSILFSSLHTGNCTPGFLNGPNWGKEADWLGEKSTLGPYPTVQTSNRRALGVPGGRRPDTPRSTYFLWLCLGLSRQHFLLNLAPKLLGLELVWLLKEKCSMGEERLPSPAPFESPPPSPVSTTWFLSLNVFQNSSVLRESCFSKKSGRLCGYCSSALELVVCGLPCHL